MIAFHSNSEQAPGDIYVVSADGGKPRNLTSHPANDVYPSFSRDGQWIYFTSTRSGAVAIWKIPAAGGSAVAVSKSHVFAGVESTDGAWLYDLEGPAEGSGSLWRRSLGGTDRVKVADEAARLFSRRPDAGGEFPVKYVSSTKGRVGCAGRTRVTP